MNPIDIHLPDYRARRITAYLDLLDKLVSQQTETLRRQPFSPESDLSKYFRLLQELLLCQEKLAPA